MQVADQATPDEHSNADWELTLSGFEPARERAVESLLAVCNGYLGTRSSLPEGHASSDPGTFIAGVYNHYSRPGPVPELIRTANWLAIELIVEGDVLSLDAGEILDHRRTLDLRRGLVTRSWRHRDPAGRITQLSFLHCVSLVDRHALLQRIGLTPENYTGQIAVALLLDGSLVQQRATPRDFIGEVRLPVQPRIAARVSPASEASNPLRLRAIGSGITVAEMIEGDLLDAPQAAVRQQLSGLRTGVRWTWMAASGQTYRLDKLVSVQTSRDTVDPSAAARAHLASLVAYGPSAVLTDHERAWAARWAEADIDVAGDPAIQRSLRLAVYHLASAANPGDDRVSIGARGLTGQVYKGHVFWDTEIFMLPFYVFTDPVAARALLMYRYHCLPAAKRRARELGYRGALYAWESALSGEDATPTQILGSKNEVIPIQSGSQEHHISADVAYGVWQYWQVTRDDGFLRAAGGEILCETARFWVSRAIAGDDGHLHIRGVVGPDEYHDSVDDDAYTNLLARWNLRRGVEVAALLQDRWPDDWRRLQRRLNLSQEEVHGWQSASDILVDGFDPETGLIEQFDGYFALDDIDLAALEPRTVAVDVLLGYERVRRSKVLKQPDALMALYLLWDEFPAAVHATNFHYYDPRTAHGSSLSPGIHAAFATRLGEMEIAGRYLRETAVIDLDDQMGNAAGGVHMAAMGSLWQAVMCGLAGLGVASDHLQLRPRLQRSWTRLRCPLRWRGRCLALTIDSDPPSWSLTLVSGPPIRITCRAAQPVELTAGATWKQDGLDELVSLFEAT